MNSSDQTPHGEEPAEQVHIATEQGEVFLGREFGHQANYSNEVAARIDAEMRVIVDNAHEEARAILTLSGFANALQGLFHSSP